MCFKGHGEDNRCGMGGDVDDKSCGDWVGVGGDGCGCVRVVVVMNTVAWHKNDGKNYKERVLADTKSQ